MTQQTTLPPALGPSSLLQNGPGKWDYSNPLPPALTPEFYQSYIISIKGKQYVKVDGLVTLMHAKGFRSIIPELIQNPSVDNNQTAIFKVTVEGWGYDPTEGKVIPITVVGHGDANPANCNAQVAAHYIRIAETRAIGRALRNYTNVNICTLEELDAVIQVDMINSTQMANIKQVMAQNNIDKDTAKNIMIRTTGKFDITTLTVDEAAAVTVALTNYTASVPTGIIPNQPVQQVTPPPIQGPGGMATINPDLDNIPGA